MVPLKVKDLKLTKTYTVYKDKQYGKLINSIREFGVLRSILVTDIDGEYNVVEGNMIVKACKELNIEEIYGRIIPNNVLAKIAINEKYFPNDYIELADIFRKNKKIYLDLHMTPLDKEQIEKLIGLLDLDMEHFKKPVVEVKQQSMFDL